MSGPTAGGFTGMPSRQGAPDMWLVDLAGVSCGGRIGWLSAEERARAARFHDPRHGHLYLAAHIALRILIESSTGIAAQRQSFAFGAAGKPCLIGEPTLYFSMSYAGGHALVGLSRIAEIGVDLERVRPIDDMAGIARSHLSVAEYAGLSLMPAVDALPAFFRGWTRKEACVKAAGTGLSLDTTTFESGLGPGCRTAILSIDGRGVAMEVGSLRPAAGLVAAWAAIRRE